MQSNKTDPHHKCYQKKIEDIFEIVNLSESQYSFFFVGKKEIAKIRKSVSNVFGALSIKQKCLFANREFKRGIAIEPEMYINVVKIPCLLQEGYCNSALILKKIENKYRFDKYLIGDSMTIDIVDYLYRRISFLLRNARVVDNSYDYSHKIGVGNKRFISIFNKRNDNEWDDSLKNMWIDLDLLTRDIADILERRLQKGFVKVLHGDLSWSNIYYVNRNFFILDPCIAAKDMYYIDMLYQLADVLVEFIKYGYSKYIGQLINLYKSEFGDEAIGDLTTYYIKRHSLIRASVHYLANDKSFKDYLQIWRQDDKYI